ncbi:hypothetical protein E5720_01550 [Rhodococcus sp. PAMC28707]|nr:hypothetical protein E5769_12465 [Rhodococcus sp. PAMC28705]QCB57379.1 hypothetical protein E5720_01550 [Rhodococcus sp. PAMC28707]
MGTVCVAVASPDGTQVHKLRLSGDRRTIRRDTVRSAISELFRRVSRRGDV